jgi:hypothetical protein
MHKHLYLFFMYNTNCPFKHKHQLFSLHHAYYTYVCRQGSNILHTLAYANPKQTKQYYALWTCRQGSLIPSQSQDII